MILALTLSLAAASGGAQAATPATQTFTPTDRWTVDAGETACIAQRPFADATGNALTLYATPDITGPGLMLLVEGPALGRVAGGSRDHSLTLASGQRIERFGISTEPSSEDRLVSRIAFSRTPQTGEMNIPTLSSGDLQRLRRLSPSQRDKRMAKMRDELRRDIGPRTRFDGDHFTVAYNEEVAHRFDTGKLAPLFDALDNCRQLIAEDFGVQPAPQAAHIAALLQDDGFDSEEIPGDSAEGIYRIETLNWVEADGGVTRCELILPTGIDAIDSRFCDDLVAKGEYLPAENADGEPIATVHHLRHRIRVR